MKIFCFVWVISEKLTYLFSASSLEYVKRRQTFLHFFNTRDCPFNILGLKIFIFKAACRRWIGSAFTWESELRAVLASTFTFWTAISISWSLGLGVLQTMTIWSLEINFSLCSLRTSFIGYIFFATISNTDCCICRPFFHNLHVLSKLARPEFDPDSYSFKIWEKSLRAIEFSAFSTKFVMTSFIRSLELLI